LGVSLGIEAEFSTELVDEFGMNHTLIENWHHERPSIEILNKVAKKTEKEVDNPRLQVYQAGVQSAVECFLHRVTVTKAEGLSTKVSKWNEISILRIGND
jgi:hypothetical protein